MREFWSHAWQSFKDFLGPHELERIGEVLRHGVGVIIVTTSFILITSYTGWVLPNDKIDSAFEFKNGHLAVGTKHVIASLEEYGVIGTLFFYLVEILEYFIKRLYDRINKDFFSILAIV